MRYKNQIWEYYMTYTDEHRLMEYIKGKGKDWLGPFTGTMKEDRFFRLLNTFRWLRQYNWKYPLRECTPTKPTNEDVLEAMDIVEEQGKDLLEFSKKYVGKEVKDIRDSLRETGKKRIACAQYYRELVEKDFFADK